MKIYTKTGDKGQTSLIGGRRVSKASLRLEAYGTADELNSFIGLLMAKIQESGVGGQEVITIIQNKLFNLGAYLATDPKREQAIVTEWLTDADVAVLEQAIDEWTAALPPLRGFILPCGNEAVSVAHVCRTITRRLERTMVALQEENADDPQMDIALKYVNRLSDFFFIYARKLAQEAGINDFLWEK